MEENEMWQCTAHWLSCLYQDFLNGRVAGEQIPCNSCNRVLTCKSCPPVNFSVLTEKSGMKMDFRSNTI